MFGIEPGQIGSVIRPALVMSALGAIFGALLAYASRKFRVKSNDKAEAIRDALPGANCGSCGYPGCENFAEAVAEGRAPANGCVVGGAAAAEKVAAIMGIKTKGPEEVFAFLKCKGSPDKTVQDCLYYGRHDCRAASVVQGGPGSCRYGCIGLGTCVHVCKFGAMSVKDGLARVDLSKCTGCGACVKVCPRGVLELVPKSSKFHVVCNSPLSGADVRKSCSVGCIGCGVCVRTCPHGAIALNGSMAAIDYGKCVRCGACAEKCPVKNISCWV